MTNQKAAQSIVNRHRADSEEHLATCHACGRPWPCDVSRLAAIVGLDSSATRSAGSTRRIRAARPVSRGGARVLLPRRTVLQLV